MMQQHFVTFYSPGSIVAETTSKIIDSWDVNQALAMIDEIFKRPNSKPYGFRFSTRSRADDELDSKVTDTSPMYYLGGTVETLEEVKARGKRSDRKLINNMEWNGWPRIITNCNSWKITQPLRDDDIVLDYPPAKPFNGIHRNVSHPPGSDPGRPVPAHGSGP